ncbi:tyrosine phosphatase-like protein [Cunninghamella echinulata]|nr:tyrosine phosphatase-like protein [Cunninghamella echinulata]
MPKDATTSKKPVNSFIQNYLFTYNIVSWFGWFHILQLAISQLVVSGGDWTTVFDITWPTLKVVQTAAIFEIVHSLIGWVRAPFVTTLMQVLSRLLLVWVVNELFPQIHTHWSYTTMITAWSIAELVRYSFYAFNLKGSVPSFISWARYNFFLVLYPTGVSSELIMIYLSLPYAKAFHPVLYYGLIASALSYIPGFPVLFSHLWVQRKKYFKGTAKKSN